MHSWKRALSAGVALLCLSAVSAFAGAVHGPHGITGKITSISPNGTSTNVVVATKAGSVTVAVSKALVKAASLTVGKTIGVNGKLESDSDGAKEMLASSVEVGGTTYPSSANSSMMKAAADGHQKVDPPKADATGKVDAVHKVMASGWSNHAKKATGGKAD